MNAWVGSIVIVLCSHAVLVSPWQQAPCTFGVQIASPATDEQISDTLIGEPGCSLLSLRSDALEMWREVAQDLIIVLWDLQVVLPFPILTLDVKGMPRLSQHFLAEHSESKSTSITTRAPIFSIV